jgi:oxygen-independent coproporphyrinogen-3 oxidase
MSRFSARTGLDPAAISATVQRLEQRGLLESVGEQIRASELGRRFLDSVIAEFFPDH